MPKRGVFPHKPAECPELQSEIVGCLRFRHVPALA